jgi:hypothetical protein
MSAAMTAPAVTLDSEQVASLHEQLAQLEPGEPYLAVVANGQVFVRSTRGLPETVIRLWRKHPAMMIPDDAGFRPEAHRVSINDL